MKKSLFSLCLLVAAGVAPSAFAAQCDGPSINVANDPYKTQLIDSAGMDVTFDLLDRTYFMSNVVNLYRATHGGASSLPDGATFMLVYVDRSRECGIVNLGGVGETAQPLPGTQRGATNSTSEPSAVYINGGKTPDSGPFGGYIPRCYDYYSNGRYTGTICG